MKIITRLTDFLYQSQNKIAVATLFVLLIWLVLIIKNLKDTSVWILTIFILCACLFGVWFLGKSFSNKHSRDKLIS